MALRGLGTTDRSRSPSIRSPPPLLGCPNLHLCRNTQTSPLSCYSNSKPDGCSQQRLQPVQSEAPRANQCIQEGRRDEGTTEVEQSTSFIAKIKSYTQNWSGISCHSAWSSTYSTSIFSWQNVASNAKTMAVFRSPIRGPDSGTVATVPVSEYCSNFCFLVQKIVQKLIN
jgi:hypothetical protein